ncbi:MAG: hypothetical protein JXN64_06350 [Spirochaetes bacterium]|nr:hypothetical protein [Spirochaetota bacterium]
MIDIFEKFAPAWEKEVARFAEKIWRNQVDDDAVRIYNNKAVLFSKRYRYELEKYYRQKGMKVYRGTLDGWVEEWQRRQEVLKENLQVIAKEKQNKLIEDAINDLQRTEKSQEMLNKLYDAKENETVYKVFSFKDNFAALSKQKGSDSAYELGTGINERIIQQYSDRYFWRTQRDKRVRKTHQKLADKCFLFVDPPKVIYLSGREHVGNPGTDYGCRCWAEIASTKAIALQHYVVRETKQDKKAA